MTADNKEEKAALIIYGVPMGLKKAFKIYCAEQGVSMSGVLVQLIGLVVERKDEITAILAE